MNTIAQVLSFLSVPRGISRNPAGISIVCFILLLALPGTASAQSNGCSYFSSDNLLLSAEGNIYEFTTDGGLVQQFPISTGVPNFYGIGHSDGRVLTLDRQQKVNVFNSETNTWEMPSTLEMQRSQLGIQQVSVKDGFGIFVNNNTYNSFYQVNLETGSFQEHQLVVGEYDLRNPGSADTAAVVEYGLDGYIYALKVDVAFPEAIYHLDKLDPHTMSVINTVTFDSVYNVLAIMAVDQNGEIYLEDGRTIYHLSADGSTVLDSVTFPDSVTIMNLDLQADGSLAVAAYDNPSFGTYISSIYFAQNADDLSSLLNNRIVAIQVGNGISSVTFVDPYGQNTGACRQIGEAGIIEDLVAAPPPADPSTWEREVTFSQEYIDPVVFVLPLSYNGGDSAVARVTEVNASSFKVKIEEPSNLNGYHGRPERVSYIVLEKGEWTIADGTLLQVGKIDSTDRSLPHRGWETVTFKEGFTRRPVLLSQVQTNNNPRFVNTRHWTINPWYSYYSRFWLSLENEEDFGRRGYRHGYESVGWMAIEPAMGTWSGAKFEAGTVYNGVNHVTSSLGFLQTYSSPPALLAMIDSYKGSDAAHLRYTSLDAVGAFLFIEEDTTRDSETAHILEDMSYLAIEVDTAPVALYGTSLR